MLGTGDIFIENYISAFCQILYKGGDRIRRTKIIPIRLIQENHDTDWDGVPNYRDCEPLNPLRTRSIKGVEDELFMHPTKNIAMTYLYAKKHFKDDLEKGDLIQFTAILNDDKTYQSVFSPEHRGKFVGRLI